MQSSPPSTGAPTAADGGDGAASAEPRQEIEALGQRRHRVKLSGAFRFSWMATLCAGLAARRLSIEHAHARREAGGAWLAELELLSLPGALDAERVSYIELAQAEPDHARDAFTLVKRHVQDAGSSLFLSIEAEDSLGLLGNLLGSFAGLMLFPIEMKIETRDGHAHDRFWLAGVGASAPSLHARTALERMLESWTVSKRS